MLDPAIPIDSDAERLNEAALAVHYRDEQGALRAEAVRETNPERTRALRISANRIGVLAMRIERSHRGLPPLDQGAL
jgi:hypothetical protein